MASLTVQLLDEFAKAPTVAHPGEDIGYDVYASRDQSLVPGKVFRVPTGIAVEGETDGMPVGFLVKDRSSMAAKGVFTHGGVIDSSYRGEIVVLMTTLADVAWRSTVRADAWNPQPPGLKPTELVPCICRGLESPLPRTKSPGLHPFRRTIEFFRSL